MDTADGKRWKLLRGQIQPGMWWAADPTPTVAKTLVKDLVPDLLAPGGLLYEKIEGMALMDDGDVYVCNDNDGVDDNSGETQLLNVGAIL